MGNIRSIELVHVNSESTWKRKAALLLPSVGESDQTLPREDSSEAAPLEVNCDGPAFFDIEAGRLSLEDNVNVVRVFPSGLADQMTCQLLDILFLGLESGRRRRPHQHRQSRRVWNLPGVGQRLSRCVTLAAL